MDGYPVRLAVDYPEKLSRGTLLLRLFFGWLYVGIPHGVCLIFYGIAAFVLTVIAWFAVLFTGKYPRGMFDFNVGFCRWKMRMNAYLFFFTDTYPPFSGKE